MYALAIIFVAFVAGSVQGGVIYDHPEYYPSEPIGYYKVPTKAIHPKFYVPVPEVLEKNYVSDEEYSGGDSVRKMVHDQQESGLVSGRGTGGSQLISVDTKGGEGYTGGAVVRGSSGSEGAVAARAEGFEKAGKGGFGGFGAGSYKKGHSNTGYHKSYSSMESGKDSSYVDQDHKEGGQHYGNTFGDAFDVSGHSGWDKAVRGAGGEHSFSGHALAGSGLHSAVQHGSSAGLQAHDSSFGRRDHLNEGQGLAHRTATAFHRPIHYD